MRKITYNVLPFKTLLIIFQVMFFYPKYSAPVTNNNKKLIKKFIISIFATQNATNVNYSPSIISMLKRKSIVWKQIILHNLKLKLREKENNAVDNLLWSKTHNSEIKSKILLPRERHSYLWRHFALWTE